MNRTEKLRADLYNEKAEYEKKLADVAADIEELDGTVAETVANEVPLKTFLWEGGNEVDWLVNGVLAAGTIGMLCAEDGLGKTCLMTQVALCLSAGISPFEGWGVPRKRKCLYLLAEGSRVAYRSRVNSARMAKNISADVGWFTQRDGFTDYQMGSRGLESIVAHSGAALVVLDTVRYFYKGDENSSDDWMRHVMIPLRVLTGKYGCTFILIHHPRKGTSADDDPRSRPRGTSAMSADLDALFMLDEIPENEGGRSLTQGKNKYGLKDRWALRFDEPNARFG